MAKVPYNKGDAYEEKILQILLKLGMVSKHFKRAGAGGGTDIIFIHKGKEYNLEVKKDLQADYGQKYFKWDKSNYWTWAVDDEVTRLYTELGVLDILRSRNIVPIKFNKPNDKITTEDKKKDRNGFENRIDIPVSALYKYYESKKCLYIQIGKGFGFYHLSKDIASLATPQFDAIIKLRFRAKTIHSKHVWNYGFLAAIKIKMCSAPSKFNIEPTSTQKFPPIKP